MLRHRHPGLVPLSCSALLRVLSRDGVHPSGKGSSVSRHRGLLSTPNDCPPAPTTVPPAVQLRREIWSVIFLLGSLCRTACGCWMSSGRGFGFHGGRESATGLLSAFHGSTGQSHSLSGFTGGDCRPFKEGGGSGGFSSLFSGVLRSNFCGSKRRTGRGGQCWICQP